LLLLMNPSGILASSSEKVAWVSAGATANVVNEKSGGSQFPSVVKVTGLSKA